MKTVIDNLLRRDGASRARRAVWLWAAPLLVSATLAWGASDAPPPTISKPAAAPVQAAAPSVTFSSGAAEILKMQEASIDGAVMKAYVEHSPGVYRLSADEIIALLQRGVPSDVVVAMLYKTGEPRTPRTSVRPVAPAPAAPAPAPAVYSAAPAVNYVYPAQTVYPDYAYEDYYPGYAVYPSSSYVSLGFGWGWPYYSYGCGWPSYGYRSGGVWGGSHYGGASHYSGGSSHYSAPPRSGSVGHVSYGGVSHFSGGSPGGGRGGASSRGGR